MYVKGEGLRLLLGTDLSNWLTVLVPHCLMFSSSFNIIDHVVYSPIPFHVYTCEPSNNKASVMCLQWQNISSPLSTSIEPINLSEKRYCCTAWWKLFQCIHSRFQQWPFDVLHELTPVPAKWRSIGIALRLNLHILDSWQWWICCLPEVCNHSVAVKKL